MVSMSNLPRTRINGATLSQHIGRPVILLGSIEQIDPSGQKIKVKASDGQHVIVILEETLQENLEGVVEFHGVAKEQQVFAQSYINFPDEYTAKFDMNLYDQAIKLIHTIGPNPWKFD